MRCSSNNGAGKDGQKLGTGLKPLHWRLASARKLQEPETGLYSQALAAFGTARGNHCAATTGFHACQEAVRACAFDFGGLVCAFHDGSYKLQSSLCKICNAWFGG